MTKESIISSSIKWDCGTYRVVGELQLRQRVHGIWPREGKTGSRSRRPSSAVWRERAVHAAPCPSAVPASCPRPSPPTRARSRSSLCTPVLCCSKARCASPTPRLAECSFSARPDLGERLGTSDPEVAQEVGQLANTMFSKWLWPLLPVALTSVA